MRNDLQLKKDGDEDLVKIVIMTTRTNRFKDPKAFRWPIWYRMVHISFQKLDNIA